MATATTKNAIQARHIGNSSARQRRHPHDHDVRVAVNERQHAGNGSRGEQSARRSVRVGADRESPATTGETRRPRAADQV